MQAPMSHGADVLALYGFSSGICLHILIVSASTEWGARRGADQHKKAATIFTAWLPGPGRLLGTCFNPCLFCTQTEYQAGSEVFRTKIEGLEALYSHIRRTRGDGNCFFRSFIFRYLEDLLARRDYEERNRWLGSCQ